jgi:hypothetical protein
MNWLTVVNVVAIVALFAWRLSLIPRRPDASTVDDEPAPPPDTSMDRARATLDWADGSRADWDRHVRPLLAREVAELLRARRDPALPQPAHPGGRLLGPDLWPLVDPAQPFTAEPDRPGPGRDGLARILDRLERL